MRLESRPAFILLQPQSRWFEPDDGIPIGFRVDVTGDATLGVTVSRAAVQAGLGAWTELPDALLALYDAGDDMPAPFAGCPDSSRVVFNDPFGELATDPRNCRGTLAIGGFCNTGETRIVNGTSFKRIVTGKVTFNDGWGDCAIWTACNLAEIATHELGHTLGLGHSADLDATMAAMAHFDGRCAAIEADDLAGHQRGLSDPAAALAHPDRQPVPRADVHGHPHRHHHPDPLAHRYADPHVDPDPEQHPDPHRQRHTQRDADPNPVDLVDPDPAADGDAHPDAIRQPDRDGDGDEQRDRERAADSDRDRVPTPSPSPTPPPTPGSWLDVLVEALRHALGALLRK